MANLDGSRSHGARWDALAGAILRDEPARFANTYRVLFHAARAQDVGPGQLPDFLGLEHGGELTLLGQEEIDVSVLEEVMRVQALRRAGGDAQAERDTERILLGAVRVGQHVFAQNVLRNCGGRCVFCGLSPETFGAKRMLLAGHIKPWKDSTPSERLDPGNGLAACPAHDVAFDTGLITVNSGLRIHVTETLGRRGPQRSDGQAILWAAAIERGASAAGLGAGARPEVSRLAPSKDLRRMIRGHFRTLLAGSSRRPGAGRSVGG
jgi:putative restriction endonuclease